MHKIIFSFLGAPGSGKGTLAQLCVQKLGFKVLSTGNLFREVMARQDTRGKLIAQYLNAGQLLPDDMVTDIVYDWLVGLRNDDAPIILDGYPRTTGQAEKFLIMLATKLPDYTLRILTLQVPDDVIIKRLAHRLVCTRKECQRVYADAEFDDQANPICPICHAPLARRQDDLPEVVMQRLTVYAQYSMPLFAFYQSHGTSVETIQAATMSPDEVFQIFAQRLQQKA